MYKARKAEEGIYRMLTNQDINNKLDGEDIVRFIKVQRIRLFQYIIRQDEESLQKKVMNGNFEENVQSMTEDETRWKEHIFGDLKPMEVLEWC